MRKTAKVISTLLPFIFTLAIIFGLTVIVIDKATGNIFFINETFCIYRISGYFILWFGVLGDACTAMMICLKKKAKKIFKALSVTVIVTSLLSIIISLPTNAVDRNFYYESSPNGKNEIIVHSYQFLIAGGGDVYYRVNPFFIRRLKNEENKRVEWFYDDYTVEWHDGYVTVDGYTYLLPEG